ncbi:MAG: NfeD family protein [Chlamydiales bacterium]
MRRKSKPMERVITKKGKLLTLISEETSELGVDDLAFLPNRLLQIIREGEWPMSQELLFTDAFFNKILHAIVKTYSIVWKTQFFILLSSPIVTSILFLSVFLGFYIEISTPGVGLPGLVAFTCLALMIVSSFSLEVANWLDVIIFSAGVLLMMIEFFLLPSIKEMTFVFQTHTLNGVGKYVIERIFWLSVSLVIGMIIIGLLVKYIIPRFNFSSLILKEEQTGYIACSDRLPEVDTVGVVTSPLRTAGKIEIQGVSDDVLSNGKFIGKGCRVRIIAIQGGRVIVEEVP